MTLSISSGATFTQYALSTSPNIIRDQSLKALWGMTKDEASLITLLSTMGARGKFGGSIKSKTPKWGIGDYIAETGVIGATFQAAGPADATITLTTSKYFAGDVLYLHEGTSSAIIRLGAATTAPTYNVSVISYDDNGLASDEFTTAATVIVLAPSADYDGAARSFLNIKPKLAQNQMQRMRDTVGAGKWERSDEFLADHSLEHLVTLGFKSLQKKINKALYSNMVATSPTGAVTYGIMGGLPYFFNPHDASYADSSGVRTLSSDEITSGMNQVDSGTGIDIDNLAEWTEKLTRKGGKDKIVNCSPLMFRKIMATIRNEVSIERPSFMDYNLGFGDVWNMPKLDLGFGTLWFNVDRGATGIPLYVVDDDDSTTAADSLHWMVAFDPMHTGIVNMEVEGEGVQDLQINPVFKERNNSIEEIEFDCTKTIAVDDPETGGYYGITNA